MLYFFRRSPVIVIGAAIIFAALVIAGVNIVTLNPQTLAIAIASLVFIAAFLSLKKHRTTPVLIIFSKSKFQNRIIKAAFFAKNAVKNNLPLLVFCVLAFCKVIKTNYFAILPAACIFSMFLSFLLMGLKHNYSNKRIDKIAVKKPKNCPAAKSIIYDYLTSDFLQMALICICIFTFFAVKIIKNINFLNEFRAASIIFNGMAIILSLGFAGILDSIPHINWKFFAIVYPQNFIYYIKRTLLFLGFFFGLFVITFIFMGVIFNAAVLLKPLYCLTALLFLSINIAFTIHRQLTKAIMLLCAVAFTAWISTLQAAFLLILAFPVIVTFMKARKEYSE